MLNFLYFLGGLLLLVGLLSTIFRIAVRRGGRKVVPIDPSAWIIQPEGDISKRLIPLTSVANIRDLGGYRTLDGRTVRWRRVYRSGELSRLSQEDMAALERLGIRLVCDLRDSREVKSRPDRLPPGARSLHCPVYEREFTRAITPIFLFKRHELGNTLGRGYTDWLEIGAEAYGRLFKALADPGNLPLLFHCTAGKDRAGIGVAILLALLGVPEETIVADYSLSNLAFDHLYADFLVDNRTDKLGIAGEEVKIMLAANPAWIKSTLKHLHEKYGGAEAYLKNTAGLSQGQIEAIRKNMLADPINEK